MDEQKTPAETAEPQDAPVPAPAQSPVSAVQQSSDEGQAAPLPTSVNTPAPANKKQQSVDNTKPPVLSIVVAVIVVGVLAAVAYYAYTNSK